MYHTFSDTQGLNYDQVALEIEIFGKITSCWLIVWTFTFQLVLHTIHDVYMIYHGLLSCPNPYQDKARRWLNVPRECLNPGRSLLLIPDAFEPFQCINIAFFSENSLLKSTYQLQVFGNSSYRQGSVRVSRRYSRAAKYTSQYTLKKFGTLCTPQKRSKT